MKKLLSPIIIVCAIAISAFAGNGKKCDFSKCKKNIEVHMTQELKEKTITFKKGKSIELAFITIRPGFEKKLKEDYFTQIIPIAAEYGGKVLGSFKVGDVYKGNLNPKMVGIFEWPSIDKYETFKKDNRAKKLFKVRNAMLSYINAGNFFEVEKDQSYTFRNDKMYMVYGVWVDSNNKKDLMTYKKGAEVLRKKQGAKEVVSFKGQAHHGEFKPDAAGIMEWDSMYSFYELMEDSEYQALIPKRNRAFKRMDILNSYVNVN